MRVSLARVSLARATLVAGLVSMLAWAAPLMAQGPQVPRPASPGAPGVAPAPAPTGTSVVVIDVAFIFKNHVRFNARMNDIKKDIEAFEAKIRTESQGLQARAEQLKQYSPSSPEFKSLEEQLAKVDADMKVNINLKRKEFLEQEARVYYDVYKEIESTVAVFCQQYRIGLVLRFNGEDMKPDDRNSVLAGVNKAVVYQQNLDITQHILQKLNAGAGGIPQQPTVGPGTPTGAISRPPTGGVPPVGRPGPGAPR